MGAVWLVGESNPYGSDPRYDLFPRPERSAGGRLCAFIGRGEHEYLRLFKRRNLLRAARWSATAAKEAAVAVEGQMAVDRCPECGGNEVARKTWAMGPGVTDKQTVERSCISGHAWTEVVPRVGDDGGA